MGLLKAEGFLWLAAERASRQELSLTDSPFSALWSLSREATHALDWTYDL